MNPYGDGRGAGKIAPFLRNRPSDKMDSLHNPGSLFNIIFQ